jgi:hypothetical protein
VGLNLFLSGEPRSGCGRQIAEVNLLARNGV